MTKEEKKIWYELYDIAYELDEYNIYEILSDTDLLCYVDKDELKLYYLSILGKSGKLKGMFFMNERQINNYLEIANVDSIQVLNYQEGYMMFMTDIEALEDEEKKILEELGLKQKFVLCFRKYQRGFMPHPISLDEAKHLTYLMNNFKPTLLHIRDKNIEPEDNKIITRFFDENIKKYKTSNLDAFYPEKEIFKYEFDLKNELSDLKLGSDIMEIDFNNYLPVRLDSFKDNNITRLPIYFSVADTIKHKIIKFDSINLLDYKTKEDYYRHICLELINLFKDIRIPKLVLVRDEFSKELLNNLGLNIEIGNLKITDNFIKMIIEKK